MRHFRSSTIPPPAGSRPRATAPLATADQLFLANQLTTNSEHHRSPRFDLRIVRSHGGEATLRTVFFHLLEHVIGLAESSYEKHSLVARYINICLLPTP